MLPHHQLTTRGLGEAWGRMQAIGGQPWTQATLGAANHVCHLECAAARDSSHLYLSWTSSTLSVQQCDLVLEKEGHVLFYTGDLRAETELIESAIVAVCNDMFILLARLARSRGYGATRASSEAESAVARNIRSSTGSP